MRKAHWQALRCADDVVFCTSSMDWVDRGGADRRIDGTWGRQRNGAGSRFWFWCGYSLRHGSIAYIRDRDVFWRYRCLC